MWHQSQVVRQLRRQLGNTSIPAPHTHARARQPLPFSRGVRALGTKGGSLPLMQRPGSHGCTPRLIQSIGVLAQIPPPQLGRVPAETLRGRFRRLWYGSANQPMVYMKMSDTRHLRRVDDRSGRVLAFHTLERPVFY